MNALEAAINAKFAATPALTAAFTGNERGDGTFAVYWDQADKGAGADGSPYLVLQQLSANATSKYGGVVYSEPVIRFKSVAVGRRLAIANVELLTAAFDDVALTLESGRVNNVTRLGDPVTTMYPPENAAGETEFESVVDYQFSISS